MKRSEILLPKDRARMEASQKKTPSESAPQNAAAPAPQIQNSKPVELPLGDVARYYRELYRLQNEQQKARDSVLPVEPAVAMPKLTAPEIILRPERRVPQSRSPRDPFSPSQREAPVAPQSPAPRHASVPQETPMAAAESIVVRRGDSLWKLAARYLGDGAKWHALLAANPQLSNPNLIQVGQQLAVPHAASTESASAYKVVRGDSMWKLAQNHLGNGMAWSCIAQANPGIADANRIYPGQTLDIPSACVSNGSADHQVSKAPPTARASN